MRSFHTALALATVSTLALSAPAMGQVAPTTDQAAPPVAPEAADVPTPDQQPDEGGEVVVTGSRISRPEISSPNPIQSFSAATFEQSGRTNITDFLTQNPALLGSTTSADASGSTAGFGAAGINLLNLRALGSDRTLVLLDGRRHVAGVPGTASVDINTLPKDLIERFDILTGGGSATYGADGVSGVVNFVLRRDFEGLRVRGQTGVSSKGDAGNQFLAITAGKNFADDRGNVALSYEYTKDDRVNSFSRRRTGDPLFSFGLVRDPTDFPDSPTRFDRIVLNNLRYADSSRGGAIDLDIDGIPDFTGEGKVYDRGRLLPSSGGLTQGGDSTPLAGYQGDLQPRNRIHNINLLSSFEVSSALRLFAQGKYANTRTFTVAQPSFDFFTYLEADNAFLQQRFGAANVTDGALVSRDNFDFGIRGESGKRETYRSVIGADGRISDNAKYELSYVYGRTDSRFLSTNYRITDRYLAALDAVRDPATGNIVCRSTLNAAAAPFQFDFGSVQFPGFNTFTPGANSPCRPLNVLGDGSPSAEALAFINADLVNTYRVQQHVVSGSISGDFGQFFSLPGGPIGFALGAEYRKEKSRFVSDPLSQQGALADLAQILPESGSFDVKEAFGELRVPVLRDMRFAHLLEFNAGLRLSDYSTVGGTTTWEVSGIYAPVRDLRIRGTYAQAVRAPNVTELFSPTNGTFAFIDDPCDPENLPEGTSTRAANCRTLLAAAGLTPAQIAAFSPTTDPTATVSLPGQAGGNRDLNEETARTWTAGIVFQPRFVPNFSLIADWYNIRIRDAVRTATAQEIVDLCVDQPTTDNVFCQSITRSSRTGFVSNFIVRPQNVAAFRTEGLDLQLNYLLNAGNIGTFNFRLNGNYLHRITFVPTPGADVEDSRLFATTPKYSGTADLTWTSGVLTINYGLNYISKTRRFTADQIAAQPDLSDPRFFFFRERWEHDLQASIKVSDDFSFYGGVNNFTNKVGDVASVNQPYSFLGRYFYFGARASLGGFLR